jgi:NAD(P)-dependent dehydrogenase (short-subunit alcohol dehydrogenase family)
MMSTQFADRTAIITGGNAGIGQATAERLASAGADVCIVGRTRERLEEVVTKITAGGGKCWSVAADVSFEDDIAAVVDGALTRWGHIDMLVNNAGIDCNEPFLDASREGWERVLAVNLTAPFRLSQHVGRAMAERGRGAIVNVASIDAYGVDGTFVSYNVSKAGLLALTRQAATELAPFGVRVNSVSPGWTLTAMAAEALTDDELIMMRTQFDRVPMKRMVTTGEVANAIAYLASDEASGITGTDLVVDAGTLANLYIIETLKGQTP